MSLPYLRSENKEKKQQEISNFAGLNRSPVIPSNEFEDMKNCSAYQVPCISPRRGRKEKITLSSTAGTIGYFDGKLAVIDGNKFSYDGAEKATLSSEGPKQMAYMNKYIVIFPDKIYYDTINDVIKHMEVSITGTSKQFKFENNKIVFNSGSVPSDFKVGDALVVSGCADSPYNNRSFVVTAITTNYIMTMNNTFEERNSESGVVTIARTVPDLSYILEHNNRLWGCDKAGTIYCSKLGSFNNFNYYNGLATDSFYTEVGSQGNFTGACSYNGKVYFFKEDIIHVMYGTEPSNFQTIDISSLGVLDGAYKTIAVTNNLLFYLSSDGVMICDGTMPQLISKKLGYIKFTEGAAGGNRQYYYISIKNNLVWEMYVYDSDNMIWTKEDNTHALNFATYKGNMLYLDADTHKVMIADENDSTEEVEWYCITGDINLLDIEKFAAMRLLLRADIEAGSTISVSVKRNNGEWMLKRTFTGPSKKDLYVPIAPLRCDSFKIKLEGKGKVKVYSIIREYTARSVI